MHRHGRALALGAALATVTAGWWACRHADRPRASAERTGSEPPKPGPPRAASPAPPAGAPPASAPEAAAEPPPSPVAGDAKLRERLRLDPSQRSATSEELGRWSPRELALFAEVERRTGRAMPDGVRDVALRRRLDPPYSEIRAFAFRRVKEALARAVVLEWLAEEYDADRGTDAAARPDASPVVKPLAPAAPTDHR